MKQPFIIRCVRFQVYLYHCKLSRTFRETSLLSRPCFFQGFTFAKVTQVNPPIKSLHGGFGRCSFALSHRWHRTTAWHPFQHRLVRFKARSDSQHRSNAIVERCSAKHLSDCLVFCSERCIVHAESLCGHDVEPAITGLLEQAGIWVIWVSRPRCAPGRLCCEEIRGRPCCGAHWHWSVDASSRKEGCANGVAAGHLLSVIAGIGPLHGIHFNIVLSAHPLAGVTSWWKSKTSRQVEPFTKNQTHLKMHGRHESASCGYWNAPAKDAQLWLQDAQRVTSFSWRLASNQILEFDNLDIGCTKVWNLS